MFSSRPACFLSTGTSRPPPPGACRKMPSSARAGVIDHLDDAAAIERAVALIQLLDAHQRAVADAGGRARLRAARHVNADFWRGAAFLGVPFGGRGEQFAVGVAAGDVGDHGRRQGGGLVDFPSALGDGAFVGEFAQDALQLDAVGILQAELAGDFPRADLARIRTDEGDDGVPARKTIVVFSSSLIPGPCPRSSSQASWVQWRASPPMSWRRTRPARAPC